MSNWFKTFNASRMVAMVEIEEEDVEVPCKFEVCPNCNGHGSHVNRSIDCNGISDQDFSEDPDFEEAYFGGAYDVRCDECGGDRVMPVPADNCPSYIVDAIQEAAIQRHQWRMEIAAERRMGA